MNTGLDVPKFPVGESCLPLNTGHHSRNQHRFVVYQQGKGYDYFEPVVNNIFDCF